MLLTFFPCSLGWSLFTLRPPGGLFLCLSLSVFSFCSLFLPCPRSSLVLCLCCTPYVLLSFHRRTAVGGRGGEGGRGGGRGGGGRGGGDASLTQHYLLCRLLLKLFERCVTLSCWCFFFGSLLCQVCRLRRAISLLFAVAMAFRNWSQVGGGVCV